MLKIDLLFRMTSLKPIWLPVRAYINCDSIFVPKPYRVTSVGTDTVHVYDHVDVPSSYCYEDQSSCQSRCLQLFTIITGRHISDYPILN